MKIKQEIKKSNGIFISFKDEALVAQYVHYIKVSKQRLKELRLELIRLKPIEDFTKSDQSLESFLSQIK